MQEGKAMRTDQWAVQTVVTESQGSEKLKMLARFLSIFPFFFFFFSRCSYNQISYCNLETQDLTAMLTAPNLSLQPWPELLGHKGNNP